MILRVRRGESPNRYVDLREAGELAIRARNTRRGFRGDSAEPTELACEAALLSADPPRVVALGVVADDGATAEEAASPVVRELVAVAACQLGELELAREVADQLDDPAGKARVLALLAEAENGDPLPLWRRAVELACDDDEALGLALMGLAMSGAAELPRLDDLAQRHPEAAAEIRALWDLHRGNGEAAINRLRARRRISISAAVGLAQAYRATGNIDAQVRVLLDGADHFRDPSLRYTAVEVLIQAGRSAEAQRELDALLSTAAPDWSGRSAALRLAAQLAVADRQHHRACELLDAALLLKPEHAETRWALIRVLVHRVTSGRRGRS